MKWWGQKTFPIALINGPLTNCWQKLHVGTLLGLAAFKIWLPRAPLLRWPVGGLGAGTDGAGAVNMIRWIRNVE